MIVAPAGHGRQLQLRAYMTDINSQSARPGYCWHTPYMVQRIMLITMAPQQTVEIALV
jgi:hypothetical protein